MGKRLTLTLFPSAIVLITVLFQACSGFHAVPVFSEISSLGSRTELKTCGGGGQGPAYSYSTHIAPIMAKYCVSCHSGAQAQGGLSLAFKSDQDADAAANIWQKVVERVRTGSMPLSGDKVTTTELARLESYLQGLEALAAGPGHVPFARLNVAEFNYAISDLFGGITSSAALAIDKDTGGAYGFDNTVELQSFVPADVDKYLQVAATAVNDAFTQAKSKIMLCTPDSANITPADCARKILQPLIYHAFRRPVVPAEVDPLVDFAVNPTKYGADNFEGGIRLALQAVLVSPNFLYRVLKSPQPQNSNYVYKLNEFELASRLSFFIWSSIPDDELLDDAKAGTLSSEERTRYHVKRMLNDPKGARFVKRVAKMWLLSEDVLSRATPDSTAYPQITQELKQDMVAETEGLLTTIVKEDRTIQDLFKADYAVVNARLANFYGFAAAGLTDTEYKKVSIADSPRRGILGQAGFLMLNAKPLESSPTRRGFWILKNFLCQEPPPPPANIPSLPDVSSSQGKTIRERLIAHRAAPACYSCHRTMDPIGFGLEHFDAIGLYRDKYTSSQSIDATGELPNGATFDGLINMVSQLEVSPDYGRCAGEHLMAYAIGRRMGAEDACAVEQLGFAGASSSAKFSDMIYGVVTSNSFRFRAGKGE
jgi:hypothetical protein